MRYAAKADTTQAPIVKAMQAMGASVWNIKWPTDLLVGYRGSTIVVEVKTMAADRKNITASDYTPTQREFFHTWKGGPVATVCDVDGAIRLLKSLEPA